MANPYASTAGAATIAATVSGNDRLNDAPGPGRSPEGSPDRDTAAVARRLLARMAPHRGLFAAIMMSAAAAVVLQLYVPVIIGSGIDLLVGAGRVEMPALIPVIARLAVVVLAASALQWLQGACINRLSCGTVRDLRIEVQAKLTRLPLSSIDRHAHGDYISRVVNDVDQVGDGLLQGLTQLFGGVVTVVATLGFMLAASVPMAIVVILVTPLSVAAAGAMAKFSSSSFARQMAIQGRLSAYVEEYVGSQRLVSAFAYGGRAHEGFERLNGELYEAGERAQFLSSLANPGTRFVNNLIYAVVAVTGFIGVVTGFPARLTVGGVQMFLAYANQYTKPFNEISGVVSQIQGALASARRIFALLDLPDEDADDEVARAVEVGYEVVPGPEAGAGAEAGAGHGDVRFEHVDFSYAPGEPVLHDICLHARPGMRVALVGPTGCGKTTLISLLLRFYSVDAGRILVDGVPIDRMPRPALRRTFGMVLQESWLFEGSVRDNIAYGRPDASRAEVEQAARRAHADSFIRALPDGYDTVLPEGGGCLSQGQRQLVCIARVMLTDPEVLLLDEATSNIDTRTELQVQRAFDELMRGRTSLVVAHRLSTVRNADLILVMRDGRIVERGTHGELMAAGGFYAELHDSQFTSGD